MKQATILLGTLPVRENPSAVTMPPMHASSYDFGKLHDAAVAVDDSEDAHVKLADGFKAALLVDPEVIAIRSLPEAPEGCSIFEVDNEDGSKGHVALADPTVSMEPGQVLLEGPVTDPAFRK